MTFRAHDLWRWSGTTGRLAYALTGIVGFGLKHNLDRCIAHFNGQPWGLFSYWPPLEEALWKLSVTPDRIPLLVQVLCAALPFVWVGTVMTLKRLRDAGLSEVLVAFFFLPFLNVVFFLILCVLPSRVTGRIEVAPPAGARSHLLDRLIPRSLPGSALTAAALSASFALGATILSTGLLRHYAWSLFVGVPFCSGLMATLLHGRRRDRTLMQCLVVSAATPAVLGALLLMLAVEGVICIAMAAPLGVALASMGGLLGYGILAGGRRRTDVSAVLGLTALSLPFLIGAERLSRHEPPVMEVTTRLEIDASSHAVWEQVVAFTAIPEPEDWLFRSGIAYPVRAEIDGRGAGAVRHCVFSTGSFLEPIEVWDEPRLLRFSVTSSPPPMAEWTPFRGVAPPHLTGHLLAHRGQFRLIAMPGGRTLVEATTWYQHSLWPVPYWQMWSDAIIRRIHLRVLRHIEDLAGRGTR